ncbi:tRNA uridine-5-carboxymethylaminomethyl(34) synthesis enzyme MnmG [Candidatus Vidania fulgoroideorum]
MRFDIIVVGGGHSGVEALNIISKLGLKVLLLTENLENICNMHCNPSIGGGGKSQLVKEIDILGGLMGFLADISGGFFKKLNTSKGLAMHSTRIQVDKLIYKINCRKLINKKNIFLIQDSLRKIVVKNNRIKGIKTNNNIFIKCSCLILTTGTFLRANIFVGENKNKLSNSYLSDQINDLIGGRKRFKTGTPPRIDEKTINFRILKREKQEFPIPYFSYRKNIKKYNPFYVKYNKLDCYKTKTNSRTLEIIMKNINLSSLYSGVIKSPGPRYCPSIEDKVKRFPGRDHIVFLEKESNFTNEYYPSGLSTSFPFKIQEKFVNSIKGLEKCKIIRYGYAIEYDCFDSRNLKKNLENKFINGLFLAGQINGTTGYEEAGSQGIFAGINSYYYIKNKGSFEIKEKDGYTGVLINDIRNFNLIEPYRIFTSRSKYRLETREDNTDIRFLKKIKKLGILKKPLIKYVYQKLIYKDLVIKYLKKNFYKGVSLYKIIRKGDYESILNKFPKRFRYISNYIFSEIIYKKYIKQERDMIKKIKRNNFSIEKIDFNKIKNLSKETLEKLKSIQPKTFFELKKISGLRKSEIVDIYIYIKNCLFNSN